MSPGIVSSPQLCFCQCILEHILYSALETVDGNKQKIPKTLDNTFSEQVFAVRSITDQLFFAPREEEREDQVSATKGGLHEIIKKCSSGLPSSSFFPLFHHHHFHS